MADPTSIIATWLTPSSLFIFVNLVIGTIAITSRFSSSSSQPKNKNQSQLTSSPSFLHRVRSFNLRHHYNTNDEPESDSESTHPQLVPKPSLLKRVVSFNLSFNKHHPPPTQTLTQTHCVQPEAQNMGPDPVKTELDSGPDPVKTELDSGPDPVKSELGSGLDLNPGWDSEKSKVKILKKSVSEKECSMKLEWEEEEDEETVERRRPATTGRSEESEDKEVDAKADDFINRFKKQLRLQRLESFLQRRDTM